jgi:hypothetical protein
MIFFNAREKIESVIYPRSIRAISPAGKGIHGGNSRVIWPLEPDPDRLSKKILPRQANRRHIYIVAGIDARAGKPVAGFFNRAAIRCLPGVSPDREPAIGRASA